MTAYRGIVALTSCLMMLSGIIPLYAEAPMLDPAEDASHPGEANSFLFWTPEQQVAGYRNIDKVFPTRTISTGESIFALPERMVNLDDVRISVEDTVLTTDEYFLQQIVAGLLVIKNGRIVYERYGLGNSKDSLWVAFSVAKSVTSLLIGAAIRDGYIKSVEEKVTDYLPRLKGSSYDQATIRNILQMSSGVQWNEDYADPDSDINTVDGNTLGLYEYLREKPRDTAPGEEFNYNTAEGIDKLTSLMIPRWEYRASFDPKTRSEWALASTYRALGPPSGSASPRVKVNLSIPYPGRLASCVPMGCLAAPMEFLRPTPGPVFPARITLRPEPLRPHHEPRGQ